MNESFDEEAAWLNEAFQEDDLPDDGFSTRVSQQVVREQRLRRLLAGLGGVGCVVAGAAGVGFTANALLPAGPLPVAAALLAALAAFAVFGLAWLEGEEAVTIQGVTDQ